MRLLIAMVLTLVIGKAFGGELNEEWLQRGRDSCTKTIRSSYDDKSNGRSELVGTVNAGWMFRYNFSVTKDGKEVAKAHCDWMPKEVADMLEAFWFAKFK